MQKSSFRVSGWTKLESSSKGICMSSKQSQAKKNDGLKGILLGCRHPWFFNASGVYQIVRWRLQNAVFGKWTQFHQPSHL